MKNHLTSYHAKFFAHELLRQLPSDDIGKLTASLQDAQVDLNPHQVEAALFAFQNPLSSGAILADEVGLGKTIEAGIILSQQWAERKRKLLIICPANLRKQWNQELLDKFYLPSIILETKTFNQAIKDGKLNPFNANEGIVICSFQFARSKEAYLIHTEWDLVVIDEAHRLRNVYKASNKIGNTLKSALWNRKKILLTATPLQNSILELYGLVSIIDDFVFGDLKSFKCKYSRPLEEEDYVELRNRMQLVCKRILRRQVLSYINYTERRAILEEFIPSEEEQQLYDWVSEYLRKPHLYALPNSQRQLMTLILRKLLASSTYAIHGTMDTMITRLQGILDRYDSNLLDTVETDYETLEEIEEEWVDEEDEENIVAEKIYTEEDLDAIRAEIEELITYRDLAFRIQVNSKANQLLIALEKAIIELHQLGANEKALIFTESRRTQEYLYDILNAKGYRIVRFNGVNNDPDSNQIYQNWLKEYAGTDRASGSPTADKRAALVDYFRNEATIMIATEAAAEGVNLQFCSLLVNYDLPWNPQRIEQRIGRCHRYGQKHDVVVVNFLNRKNAADVRVYELLDQKFKLFSGVFGASDEVLGAIGNGLDFEKRIAQIYNDCRTPDEIQLAFDVLQQELQPEIDQKMQTVRSTLLENFDEEVREKLRIDDEQTKAYLNAFEQKLWKTTRYFLNDFAHFAPDGCSFTLQINPFPDEPIHPGPYRLLKTEAFKRKSEVSIPDDTNIYRVGHRLAQRILQGCQSLETPLAEVIFDYNHTPTKITTLETLVGRSGWLRVFQLSINSFEQEDHLLLACVTDEGDILEKEIAERLFSLNATVGNPVPRELVPIDRLDDLIEDQVRSAMASNIDRNQTFFESEMEKLEQWADDMKIGLEKEIKDLDAEIKLRKSEAKKLLNLESKVRAQRQIKELEKKRSEKRRSLFVAQDEIDARKEELLSSVESRLKQHLNRSHLFTIRWTIT